MFKEVTRSIEWLLNITRTNQHDTLHCVQDLRDPQVFYQLGLQQPDDLHPASSAQEPSVQELVVCKQLASMDHALSLLRDHQ